MIRIDNLYILPGVPGMFAKLLETWSHVFVSEDKFFREIIYTNLSESTIASDLTKIQAKYSSTKIGSYPAEPDKSFKVMISIEGPKERLVLDATREIMPLIEGRKAV
jgi:molybdopterin-biosynthesis enzyme MoeA-like protein